MSNDKNVSGYDIQKAFPWAALILLVIILFYLWPHASQERVENKKNRAETTASVESTGSAKNKVESSRAEITSPILNFRSKPAIKERNVIAALSKGTQVKVLEIQGDWLKVQLDDGRIGFITSNKKYINYIKE